MPNNVTSAYSFAVVYAALVEKDKAFEQLERSPQEYAADFIYIKVGLFLAKLRADQRNAALLQRSRF